MINYKRLLHNLGTLRGTSLNDGNRRKKTIDYGTDRSRVTRTDKSEHSRYPETSPVIMDDKKGS